MVSTVITMIDLNNTGEPMDSKLLDKPHEDNSRMVPEASQGITVGKLKALLPAKTNVAVTQEIVDTINSMEDDTGLPQELLEEDVMSYMYLVGSMKGVGIKGLVNAIKYCNLKRNYDNKEAWAITFPGKHDRLVEGNKQVDNHVSMYNSSKLVVAIDKEMLIPVSITYMHHFHAATKELYNIGVLGKGGQNADGKEMTVTPMVKVQALKELTSLTKPIEENKLAVTINPGEAAVSMQEEMNAQLKAIVAHQKKQIDDGMDVIDAQVIGINFDNIGIDNE